MTLNLTNRGNETLINYLKKIIDEHSSIYIYVNEFSIYALYDLLRELKKAKSVKFILTDYNQEVDEKSFSRRYEISKNNKSLTGNKYEIHLKNKMNLRYKAEVIRALIRKKLEFRILTKGSTANQIIIRNDEEENKNVFIPYIQNLSSDGLGTTTGDAITGITVIQGDRNIVDNNIDIFKSNWNNKQLSTPYTKTIFNKISNLAEETTPEWLYYVTLYHVFNKQLDELDEDNTIKRGTGFKDTVIWNKLYQFQKDGVISLINKLEKHNGAILADSVGLGKTFSALAIIKYYELRNYKVLVLTPKRLRANWTIYTKNDVRNILVDDRFNYDVLNHTDLSRYKGKSGDINLSTLNWSNYDLIVIDESHNFRNNNPTNSDHPTRYQRLMNEVIKSGVNTKVLMLSATPVNNRMNDLKNQIAFITEDNPESLEEYGVDNVDNQLALAQRRYNEWTKLPEKLRTTERFLETVNPAYFKILDLLTVARSRKHITKYYVNNELGSFPERLKPISIRSDIDIEDSDFSIKDINDLITSLNLSMYQQMAYILPNRIKYYENLYDTKTEKGTFKQIDREFNLTGLIRVNLLKRLESSINSFLLSINRMIEQLEYLIKVIDSKDSNNFEFPSITNFEDDELEDAFNEYSSVGNKNKILLGDMDLIRWRADLQDDLIKLKYLQNRTMPITPVRDAKLKDLKDVIDYKLKNSINPGNKKILIFTAFTDTADYLYENLSQYIKEKYGLYSAVVKGSGVNRTNNPSLKSNSMEDILINFSPLSKHRDKIYTEKIDDIDILIGTDTISEGQNLQDADCVINYDIHWNPVRVIQRFGRIDRIGSLNEKIQLINFWPNMELDEYINLERRVKGRMVLVNVSATGEDDLLNQDANKKEMNDLAYRRKTMKQLQDEVVDLEDIDGAISITDLTYNEFKSDLSQALKTKEEELVKESTGIYAITDSELLDYAEPGAIFTLKQLNPNKVQQTGITPYLMIYMLNDGTVKINHLHANKILSIYKKLTMNKNEIFPKLIKDFYAETKNGKDMSYYSYLLSEAINEIKGKTEEAGVRSLFTAGGTMFKKIDNIDDNDYELISLLIIR